jgi:hypothetical protein
MFHCGVLKFYYLGLVVCGVYVCNLYCVCVILCMLMMMIERKAERICRFVCQLYYLLYAYTCVIIHKILPPPPFLLVFHSFSSLFYGIIIAHFPIPVLFTHKPGRYPIIFCMHLHTCVP